ncbi:MAG: UvrD-helicase domain-containing protein [Lentisphaerota bacterium]
MNIDEIMENLNEEQRKAVADTESYVRVIAGPGTGKTTVLTSRLCRIIANGVAQETILCVTFTNKAADEMRQRILAMTGSNMESNICTFHSFCYQFLRKNIHLLYFPNQFMVMDADYQMKMLREVYAEHDFSPHYFPLDEMLQYISEVKNNFEYITRSGLMQLPLNIFDPRNKIVNKYFINQQDIKALDFDDILHFTLHILRNNPDILAYWQNRLEYIQVDEFQDINRAQFLLIEMLQGKHKNLFVVGDPDQTIYSWRGADIGFINDFEQKFPGTQTYMLTTNYRSNSSIVNVCNSLICNNINRVDRPLVAATKLEDSVRQFKGKDISDEANFIAELISKLKVQLGREYSDVAILYRSNYISRPIEEALINLHIPYRIVKGTAFYDRQEIKDALAFLRLLVYGDDISFLRVINVPARKMGALRIEYLRRYAHAHNVSLLQALMNSTEHKLFKHREIVQFILIFSDIKSRLGVLSVSKVLDEILGKTGYEEALRYDLKSDRIDNIQELKQSIARLEDDAGGKVDVGEYLADVALYADLADEQQQNSVQLMTIHSAKGLEFPYVIVCGMNEGKFPSSKISSEEEIEEERRLAYVAFTRAQKGLLLTSAGGVDFKNIPMKPSRFLSEVSSELIGEYKRSENWYFSDL